MLGFENVIPGHGDALVGDALEKYGHGSRRTCEAEAGRAEKGERGSISKAFHATASRRFSSWLSAAHAPVGEMVRSQATSSQMPG